MLGQFPNKLTLSITATLLFSLTFFLLPNQQWQSTDVNLEHSNIYQSKLSTDSTISWCTKWLPSIGATMAKKLEKATAKWGWMLIPSFSSSPPFSLSGHYCSTTVVASILFLHPFSSAARSQGAIQKLIVLACGHISCPLELKHRCRTFVTLVQASAESSPVPALIWCWLQWCRVPPSGAIVTVL